MTEYKRVFAKISKEALESNIKNIKMALSDNVMLMPVIKADAYGHCALSVAKVLKPYADFFAVAVIEEALQIKAEGIQTPIFILGYVSPQDFEEIVKNDIRIPIFTYEAAKKLSLTAQKLNKEAIIHIAIDTGMNRIGFKASKETVDIIKKISNLPNLFIEGIFTHFATADEKDQSFTTLQNERFTNIVNAAEERGINIPIKHVSNSAAIISGHSLNYNMVRSGIVTYGLYPSNDVEKEKLSLKPAMEYISHVVYVKTIEKGETVSYGRDFVAQKTTKVATIPVGYADGYPRALSNKGRVIINGEYAPIIGRICMDQFMVDVTHIESVKEGDTVTLFGSQGNATISVDEIAKLCNTINYEIICGLSKRVPRIFV